MKFGEKVDIVQAIVTTIAIIIGGMWTYNVFIKERRHYPQATIEQYIEHISLSDEINLLHVKITLTNAGTSRLFLKKTIIRIQQIVPVPPCIAHQPCAAKAVNTALKKTQRNEDRFSWPLLSEREKIFERPLDIEPGEKDVVDFEFPVPLSVRAIRVYSYFKNEVKSTSDKEVGWTSSEYYRFDGMNERSVR